MSTKLEQLISENNKIMLDNETTQTLHLCVSFLADLNGCKWITDDGPGGIDMRNRAKSLQEILFDLINKRTNQ